MTEKSTIQRTTGNPSRALNTNRNTAETLKRAHRPTLRKHLLGTPKSEFVDLENPNVGEISPGKGFQIRKCRKLAAFAVVATLLVVALLGCCMSSPMSLRRRMTGDFSKLPAILISLESQRRIGNTLDVWYTELEGLDSFKKEISDLPPQFLEKDHDGTIYGEDLTFALEYIQHAAGKDAVAAPKLGPVLRARKSPAKRITTKATHPQTNQVTPTRPATSPEAPAVRPPAQEQEDLVKIRRSGRFWAEDCQPKPWVDRSAVRPHDADIGRGEFAKQLLEKIKDKKYDGHQTSFDGWFQLVPELKQLTKPYVLHFLERVHGYDETIVFTNTLAKALEDIVKENLEHADPQPSEPVKLADKNRKKAGKFNKGDTVFVYCNVSATPTGQIWRWRKGKVNQITGNDGVHGVGIVLATGMQVSVTGGGEMIQRQCTYKGKARIHHVEDPDSETEEERSLSTFMISLQ